MRVPGAVVTAIAAIAVSGCGGGDDDDVVAEPAAMTAEKADVEQAYLAYWDMVTRIETTAPTQDPEIAELTTGPALVKLTSEIGMLELSNQLNLHEDGYEHRVLSVELDGAGSDEATLHDCFVDDATVVDRTTLDPVPGEDQGPTTMLLEVTLVSRETWQVETLETLETFDGATPASCNGFTGG
jgi:hypothetical protein